MLPIFFRPGQQIWSFEIYRKGVTEDSKGRVIFSAEHDRIGSVKGTISQASQREKDQWNQMGHPITHTVTVRGRTAARASDELRLDGRVFTIQGKDDPAELGIFSILYCLERLGVTN